MWCVVRSIGAASKVQSRTNLVALFRQASDAASGTGRSLAQESWTSPVIQQHVCDVEVVMPVKEGRLGFSLVTSHEPSVWALMIEEVDETSPDSQVRIPLHSRCSWFWQPLQLR